MKRAFIFLFVFASLSVNAQFFINSSMGLSFSKPITDKFFNYTAISMYSSVNFGYHFNKLSLRTGAEAYGYTYQVNGQTGRANLYGFPVELILDYDMPLYIGFGYEFKSAQRTEGVLNKFYLHSFKLNMGLQFKLFSKWRAGIELDMFKDFAGSAPSEVFSLGQTLGLFIKRNF